MINVNYKIRKYTCQVDPIFETRREVVKFSIIIITVKRRVMLFLRPSIALFKLC